MCSERIIGWDIGGAHLKAVLLEQDGKVHQVLQLPCPLWQGEACLHQALDQAAAKLGVHAQDRHAVTMTGEMTDIYSNRNNGVNNIINVITNKFPDARLSVFAGAAGFLPTSKVAQATQQIASANWWATAEYLSTVMPRGLLIDIGSTTADLVPFADGVVIAKGHTDVERLRHQELVYTGIVRTPVMSLAKQLPFGGEWIGLMAEHFATCADVYRILGKLPDNADQYPAADGGDKTLAASERRLARMLGMDAEAGDTALWHDVASYLQECQLRTLMDACAQQLSRRELDHDAPLVGAGTGRFLASILAQRSGRDYLDINQFFAIHNAGQNHVPADCAPAVAVAALLQRKMNLPVTRRAGVSV